jgi:CheY-like chemotaxis protein
MRILILEDAPERIKSFKKRLSEQELYIFTDNNEEARNFINTNETVDYMLLDHDLGGLHHVDSNNENTGYQFVKYMVDNKLQKYTRIIIHSMDAPGATKMKNLLEDNGYNVKWIPYNILTLYGEGC